MIIPELGASLEFPPVEAALLEPNGLLAVGGDLTPARLLEAYRLGIFPWFGANEPLLWWSPDPRAVITPQSLHISKSMRRVLKTTHFDIHWNRDFEKVMQACAAPRTTSPGTWIVPPMLKAYSALHVLGAAHSIEVWRQGRLIGGLYGVALGPFFFGESMFSYESNASKIALISLVSDLGAKGLQFLDCQMLTPHLTSMGAITMDRVTFTRHLQVELTTPFVSTMNINELAQSQLVAESVLKRKSQDG